MTLKLANFILGLFILTAFQGNAIAEERVCDIQEAQEKIETAMLKFINQVMESNEIEYDLSSIRVNRQYFKLEEKSALNLEVSFKTTDESVIKMMNGEKLEKLRNTPTTSPSTEETSDTTEESNGEEDKKVDGIILTSTLKENADATKSCFVEVVGGDLRLVNTSTEGLKELIFPEDVDKDTVLNLSY